MIKRILFSLLAVAGAASGANLGMDRESYGVFDRSGWNTVEEFPFTIGQEYQTHWATVHPARHTYDFSAIDAQLQFAYEQKQKFFIKIQPITNGNKGAPEWVYGDNYVTNSNGHIEGGVPRIDAHLYTYGYYLDEDYQTYFSEMVMALGDHLRNNVPPHLQGLIAFVRVDTGCTGDEAPYENPDDVDYVAANYPQYVISKAEWRDFRLWLFDVYDQAFQEGTGYQIPLLFQAVTPEQYPTEWNWCTNNITAGLGVKYAGEVRGHHLNGSKTVTEDWKHLTVDSDYGLFSRNEMDQTWKKAYFQLNIRLGMYWCAVEQLHPGMSVWDVTQSCLDNTYIDDYEFAFEFFNKWAAELVPATAGGGFCIFHEGLDASDDVKFPLADFGGGNLKKTNTNRYTAICAAYADQGAQMDDLEGAAKGQVAQRGDGLTGFNDSGFEIIPGNYQRFITQIDPDNTSIGLWRINGPLTASSHPYDRFARGFQHSSGRNTMYFDVHDDLIDSATQRIQLSVIYMDSGTGSFELQYDAVGSSNQTAFVVNKTGSNTWKTNSVVVSDGVFGNNGPNGADLMLLNVDSDDDIFHMLEVIKLADVSVGTVGQGRVTARHGATTYDPASGVYMEGQRLDLTPVPEPGWSFSHWSGAFEETRDDWARLYPVEDTRVTAHFVYDGTETASDDFETGDWSGGSGWSGAWSLSGGTVVDNDGDLGGLVAHLTSNGQVTRTAGTAVSSARLDFDFEVNSVDAGESVQAEVYDGSWHTVWSRADADPVDEVGSASIDLSAYGTVSQVRFTLNANGGADHLYIDNVVLSGDGGGSEPTRPEFNSDPFEMASAEIGASYAGSITNRAADPDGDPMTFSKLSGPNWLLVSTNGTLSGIPSQTDLGLNSWTVEVDDGIDGSDTAMMIINVSTNANPSETAPTFFADPFSKSDALADAPYREFISSAATDPDQQALSFYKLSGPDWLNIETNGMVWGTPEVSDFGNNTFNVRVTDTDGYSGFADLEILVNAQGAASFFLADFEGSQAQSGLVTQSSPTPDPFGGLANLNAGTSLGTWSAGSLLGSSVYTNLSANKVLFAGTGGYALTANLSSSAMIAGSIQIDLNYAICRTGTSPTRRNFITGLDETNQEVFKIWLSGNSGDDGGKTLYLETSGTSLLLASSVARAAVNNFADTGLDQLEIGLSTNGISISLNSTELTNGVALLSATDHLSKLLFEGDSMWYDNLAVSSEFGGEPVGSYGIWAGAHALEQMPDGDDDFDGLSNLGEYALNGNPTNANDTGLVEVQVDSSWFTFVHASNVVDSTLVYRLLDRTNLVSGMVHTNYWDSQTIGLPDGDYAVVSNHYAVGEQEQRFIRLHLEQE